MPHFNKRCGGTFAVVNSVASKFGIPMSGSYSGSKFALSGYFEALRIENMGVNVVSLVPGPTISNVFKAAATEKVGEAFGQEIGGGDMEKRFLSP